MPLKDNINAKKYIRIKKKKKHVHVYNTILKSSLIQIQTSLILKLKG